MRYALHPLASLCFCTMYYCGIFHADPGGFFFRRIYSVTQSIVPGIDKYILRSISIYQLEIPALQYTALAGNITSVLYCEKHQYY